MGYVKRMKKGDVAFTFLIDFENTRSRVLQGTEYLLSDDFVTIFYSQACLLIEHGRFRQIEESGCGLDIYKSQSKGKNALDFYIAFRIGEIYGQGCGESYCYCK